MGTLCCVLGHFGAVTSQNVLVLPSIDLRYALRHISTTVCDTHRNVIGRAGQWRALRMVGLVCMFQLLRQAFRTCSERSIFASTSRRCPSDVPYSFWYSVVMYQCRGLRKLFYEEHCSIVDGTAASGKERETQGGTANHVSGESLFTRFVTRREACHIETNCQS